MDAIELAQNGYDGKQIQEILLREKFESSIYIMVDTLSYLKKVDELHRRLQLSEPY